MSIRAQLVQSSARVGGTDGRDIQLARGARAGPDALRQSQCHDRLVRVWLLASHPNALHTDIAYRTVLAMRILKLSLIALSSLFAVLYLLGPLLFEVYGVPDSWQLPLAGLCLVGWIGLTALDSWRGWPSNMRLAEDGPAAAGTGK